MTGTIFAPRPSVAVVGAGIAGLACARVLADAGLRVTVYEKSRGLGGRLATRRPFGRDHPLGVDHGAPYAETPSSGVAPAGFAALGADWGAAPAGARIGVPGMSALAAPLAEGLRVARGVEIVEVAHGAQGAGGSGGSSGSLGGRGSKGPDWLLIDAQGGRLGPFDALVSAIPAPQAARLLGTACPEAAVAEMAPCWTLILAVDGGPASTEAPLIRPDDGPFELIVRNAAKPGREASPEGWAAHARPDWSLERLELDREAVLPILMAAFAEAVGAPPPTAPAYAAAHRWRYARTRQAAGAPFALGGAPLLGACGDWFLGPTAGDAYASGAGLGPAMAAALTARRPAAGTPIEAACPRPAITPRRRRRGLVVPVDFLGALVALLRLDRQGRDRPGVETVETDRVARHLAIAVGAVLETAQRGVDLPDQLTLTVAGSELETPIALLRGAVGEVRQVEPNFLKGRDRRGAFVEDGVFPVQQLPTKILPLTGVHKRLVVRRFVAVGKDNPILEADDGRSAGAIRHL